MKYLVVLSIVFSLTAAVSAQETVDKNEMFEEGQFFFERTDYKEALYFFKRLVNEDVDNAHFNFKVGECYLNIPGQEHLAVPYFELAAKRTVPKRDYKGKEVSEVHAPLHAYFYLGNAYRMAGELELALVAYNKFIDSPYFYGFYNLGVVEREMKSCERAKIIQDSPIDLVTTKLDEPIASEFTEYNPVLSHDGTKMAFVRGLKFYEAIFVSELIEGKWSKPVNISPEIGSDGDYFPTGLSTDGTVLLMTRMFNGDANIYYSEFNGKVWSKAQKLPGKANTIANETYASFGENDETIYIVSDNKRGRGGKDIWISQKSGDGDWKKAKNMGKVINTELDEETPMICRKNKTLFFSSKGHYNMGGFDIFYTNQEEEWSIPRNIGYPFNSTRDDLFYTVNPDCNSGYYSVIDLETGLADIYLMQVNSVLAIPE